MVLRKITFDTSVRHISKSEKTKSIKNKSQPREEKQKFITR